MGDPQPAYGASRYLEVLLRERFPHEKFEVVNLGVTAINSHVILPIAREVASRGQGDFRSFTWATMKWSDRSARPRYLGRVPRLCGWFDLI